MNLISKRIRSTFKIIILFVILTSSIFLLTEKINKYSIVTDNSINTIQAENQVAPRSSFVKSDTYTNVQWMENRLFSTGINPWLNATEGDSKDINATYSNGVANFEILGDSGKYELIVDPKNTTEMDKWTRVKKSEDVIYPDNSGINEEGFYANHYWEESDTGGQDNNSCAVRWKRVVQMPVNMSDYKITSASIGAKFNATVESDSDESELPPFSRDDTDDWGGIEVPNDYTSDNQDDNWDSAYFSVEISSEDIPQIKTEVAYNKTKYLGIDNPTAGQNDASWSDTEMTLRLDESVLISVLESSLSVDDYNFIVILGIDIFCADNFDNYDSDNFKKLLIRYLNLTFTYEKIIDYGTSLSWYQIGDEINYTTKQYYSHVDINDVQMNFDYKIDESWDFAPTSEIQIHINNNEQKIYPHIKLRDYDYDTYLGAFVAAREENYDFTNLIQAGENITLSIQVYLSDQNFWLDHIVNISIDNIDFRISYTVFYNLPDIVPPADDDGKTKTETSIIEEPWFNLLIAIAAIAGATCLTGYIVYYIRVLKYPKPVRKVRKYRRTLKKKKSPDIPILGRDIAFDELYKGKLETIGSDIKRKSLKPITIGEKSVEKISKKISPDKVDKLIGKTKK